MSRTLCLAVIIAVVSFSSARAVNLGASDDLADGTLTGSDDSVKAQSGNLVYQWADKDGNGTPGPVATAGLNLGTYSLSRTTADGIGFTLDLNDGTTNGAITGTSGQLTTARNPADAFPVGSISITNATDVMLEGIYTEVTGGAWSTAGALSIHQSGNLTVSNLWSYNTHGGAAGGDVKLRGGGPNAGAATIRGSIVSRGGAPAGSVLIIGYRGVWVGGDGINAYNLNLSGVNDAGQVAITNIGAGGVLMTNGSIVTYDYNGSGTVRPHVTIQTAGPVVISNINARAGEPGSGSWHSIHAGDVTILATGSVQVTGLIETRQISTAAAYADNGGRISIRSFGGSVSLASLDTSTVNDNSTAYAGDVAVTSRQDLAVNGTINLSYGLPASVTRRGILDLVTESGGGGKIRIGDSTNDTLDLNTLQYVRLNSDSLYTWIGGAVTNFSTNHVSGVGLIKDPFVTTQTQLRCPAGQKIYYNYEAGVLNNHLGGYAYKLADLAGNAGQGGILLVTRSDTRGTMITMR